MEQGGFIHWVHKKDGREAESRRLREREKTSSSHNVNLKVEEFKDALK